MINPLYWKNILMKLLSWLPKPNRSFIYTTQLYNTVPDKKDDRDIIVSSAISPLPIKYCIAFNPPVRSQGDIGSCASHAVIASHESQLLKEGRYIEGSELFHYYNARKYVNNTYPNDTGMSIRDAWKTQQQFGMAMEKAWPYDETRYNYEPPKSAYWLSNLFQIERYERLTTIEHIKDSLRNDIPVVCGIWLDDNYFKINALNTLWSPTKKGNRGGHAQRIIGYNDETRQFTLVNSWGGSFGYRGKYYIPYESFNIVSFDWWRGITKEW